MCRSVPNMRISSRWEISVSSSCCSSSSTLRWEWSSLANWVSHTTGNKKKHIHTHAPPSSSFSRKGFESSHYYHSHDFEKISPPESSLSTPICLPVSLSLCHIRDLFSNKRRSHLHDHIYLHIASSIGPGSIQLIFSQCVREED